LVASRHSAGVIIEGQAGSADETHARNRCDGADNDRLLIEGTEGMLAASTFVGQTSPN
jgi:hypothetical protein